MFTKLIEELVVSGLTEKQIGEHVGASQPTINRMKKPGYIPRFDVGSGVVELHRQRVVEKAAAERRALCAMRSTCGEPCEHEFPKIEVRARACCERRDDERRADDPSFGEFGERRGPDRRQEGRRREDCENEASA